MLRKKRVWIAGSGVLAGAAVLGGFFVLRNLSRRVEPYIRQQAIEYLTQRFDSEVQLSSLKVRLPKSSPFRLLISRGRGGHVRIEGQGLSLWHRGRHDRPPLFTIEKFGFDLDTGTLFDETRTVSLVSIDGMKINVPPKGDRTINGNPGTAASAGENQSGRAPAVLIQHVSIQDAELLIWPKDPEKKPLRFDIHRLQLDAQAGGAAMKYTAALTNAMPPGEIVSSGSFGPWLGEEPGDTMLKGQYTFANADLGVFAGIAGILKSTGSFEGALNAIHARGQAEVPDFRLKMAGNAVPLSTRFEVLVDGTNGNTTLKPVQAVLGTTQFTTSGAVIKHEGDRRRSIDLQVSMPSGDLRDLLRLASKGPPFMDGKILLETKIEIPPLTGKVREKLILDGRFELLEGKFLRSTIQEQIDQLSRRGRGEPNNRQIDEVVSYMGGEFRLENEAMTFRSLVFGVPGAHVQLAGNYSLNSDALDFHGNLRLQAKVSQTVTGWKRWALKPINPLFSKRGAGTFLPIKVDGTPQHPQFGLDRKAKDPAKKLQASLSTK
ncbi:MAG TPA: AsmA-like C-terminal region-containing protein [Bryobacteraceae bacterium]|nr:AsmA-like C-terminal region-containing protein [Bryobacteraceae bacterium]